MGRKRKQAPNQNPSPAFESVEDKRRKGGKRNETKVEEKVDLPPPPPPPSEVDLQTEVPSPTRVSNSSTSGLLPLVSRVRNYKLGPKLKYPRIMPFKCMEMYLARKDNSDEFYVIKMIPLEVELNGENDELRHAHDLLMTEFKMLDAAKNVRGVVHQHGLFQENFREGVTETTEKARLCLVLDCYVGHDYGPLHKRLVTLRNFLGPMRLPETTVLLVFHNLLEIIANLHEINIVHRDLRLMNIIVDKTTFAVTLANFHLATHSTDENEIHQEWEGAAFITPPEIIKRLPCTKKPCDMWGLGVTLYCLLYGEYPFFDIDSAVICQKIVNEEFKIPSGSSVTHRTASLLTSLLKYEPTQRMKARDALMEVKDIIRESERLTDDSDDQAVPECTNPDAFLLRKSLRNNAVATKIAIKDAANALFGQASASLGSSESSARSVELLPTTDPDKPAQVKWEFDTEAFCKLHAMYMAYKMMKADGLPELGKP